MYVTSNLNDYGDYGGLNNSWGMGNSDMAKIMASPGTPVLNKTATTTSAIIAQKAVTASPAMSTKKAPLTIPQILEKQERGEPLSPQEKGMIDQKYALKAIMTAKGIPVGDAAKAAPAPSQAPQEAPQEPESEGLSVGAWALIGIAAYMFLA